MKKISLILLALVLAAPSRAFAEEEETFLWKVVEGWQLRVDPSVGYGCFLMAVFETGTAVRIGINRDSHNGYLMLMNEKWRSLEVGKEYPISVKFDDETPWTVKSRAISMGDTPALTGNFSDGTFLSEFARKRFVELYYNNKMVGRLSLRGSAPATLELIECQRRADAAKLEARSGPSGDPFDEAPNRRTANDDPFAN